MPHPDQQPIDLGDKFPQDRNLKYLVVDSQGGFVGKSAGKILQEMGFVHLDHLTIDEVGVDRDQISSQIGASDMIICMDKETENRIWSALDDKIMPVISLNMTSEERYQATPRGYGGSPQSDSNSALENLKAKLVSFGFQYPKND